MTKIVPKSETVRVALPILAVMLGGGVLLIVLTLGRQQGNRGAMTIAGADRGAGRVLGKVPDITLVDQTGEAFGTDQLHAKVWIANFIFTRCVATCPRQTSQMVGLQEHLRRHNMWNDVRLVSFSVDPEHDTPEVLAEYARSAGADDEHWRFLTGSREAIWKLARDGFKLAVGQDTRNAGMPITHTSRTVLVDRLGRIRGYYDGLSQDGITALKRDVDFLLGEKTLASPPTVPEK